MGFDAPAVRRVVLLAAGVVAVSAVGGTLHYADSSATAVFVFTGIALGGLAWLIGAATESVGARFGPAVTGVLQSTLGNLPELFIVLFSLSAGEIVVAQTSILGSLFANALLVLGPRDRRRRAGRAGRGHALPQAAAERHGDASPARPVRDRASRPLRPASATAPAGTRWRSLSSAPSASSSSTAPGCGRTSARTVTVEAHSRSRATPSSRSASRSCCWPAQVSPPRSSPTGSSTRSTRPSRRSGSRRRSRAS